MNNEKIIEQLQSEINYFMEIKHTEITPWAKKIIEERLLNIKKVFQEAQKQKDDEIENYKTALKLLTEDYEELKSSLAKGDVHTQQDKTRKKVATSETEDKLSVKTEDKTAEPLDKADVSTQASAPKDNNLGCGKEVCGVYIKDPETEEEDIDINLCGDYCPYHKKIEFCPECEKKNKNFVPAKDENTQLNQKEVIQKNGNN